jgi:hypothetical protein
VDGYRYVSNCVEVVFVEAPVQHFEIAHAFEFVSRVVVEAEEVDRVRLLHYSAEQHPVVEVLAVGLGFQPLRDLLPGVYVQLGVATLHLKNTLLTSQSNPPRNPIGK